MKKKVAFVYPDAFSIWIFRRGLARALMAFSYDVYAVAREDQYSLKLEQMGIKCIHVDFERFLSPKKDLQLLLQLLKVFRRERFDIVHNFTIKANIYGSLMARLAGVPVIYNSVTGLGFLFKHEWEDGLRNAFIKKCVASLYSVASHFADRTWFQNPEDVAYFSERKLIAAERSVLIKSSGIDLDFWDVSKIPSDEVKRMRDDLGLMPENMIVIMVSRAIRAKGVYEFIEAANHLKSRFPDAKFVLVGGTEENGNNSINTEYLQRKMNQEGSNFIWLGHRDDIPLLLAGADICVLPSYYREGVPRNILEGMAMAKPIITTDSVGCRETVEDGWNGYIIPIKNSRALADAVEKLCLDSGLRKKMGQNSRLKAEMEFDEKMVVDQLLKGLYLLNDHDL